MKTVKVKWAPNSAEIFGDADEFHAQSVSTGDDGIVRLWDAEGNVIVQFGMRDADVFVVQDD
jgi:hypothetical protein